jgi:hypothetical protein
MSEANEPTSIEPEWLIAYRARKAAGTLRKYPRSVSPRDYQRGSGVPLNAAGWLLPWNIDDYPGFRNGLVELLNGRVTWHGIREWHRGRRTRWPVWAMEVLRSAVASRLKQGQTILAELDACIEQRRAEPIRRNAGFCAVHEDGRDRRGNWRR